MVPAPRDLPASEAGHGSHVGLLKVGGSGVPAAPCPVHLSLRLLPHVLPVLLLVLLLLLLLLL